MADTRCFIKESHAIAQRHLIDWVIGSYERVKLGQCLSQSHLIDWVYGSYQEQQWQTKKMKKKRDLIVVITTIRDHSAMVNKFTSTKSS
jgi:hypothetical protein